MELQSASKLVDMLCLKSFIYRWNNTPVSTTLKIINKTPFPIKCWLKVHGIMIGHCFVSKEAKGITYQGQKRKTEVKGG